MMAFVDTHTHLYVEEFDEDRELALIRAGEAGVARLFMPNIDDTTVDAMLALCRSHEGCYPMIGFHPTSVDADWKARLAAVRRWLDSPQTFYGIGEVGLDLYWDKTYKKEQMQAFEIQIEWALEHDLPLVVHCREAYPELFEVLAPYKETGLRGIFHSFTGTEEEAARLLEYTGFLLGINGVVTFKKSVLPSVLPHVPLGRIVLETDSPYLAPVPYRGKRNESAYLVEVAGKLSEIYSVPLEEIARVTTENACRMFRTMDLIS
ncbi:MAG TPA: TatD family hydrolase [Candidatus Phocaeicola excrementigallinarum]|nr:TatD family hydrolase [Candidatus Phocaeicola excrementigallinarum]